MGLKYVGGSLGMTKTKYANLIKENERLLEENEKLLEDLRSEQSKVEQAIFCLETDMKRFRGVFDDVERTVYRLRSLK